MSAYVVAALSWTDTTARADYGKRAWGHDTRAASTPGRT
jgi:hypothetical protein